MSAVGVAGALVVGGLYLVVLGFRGIAVPLPSRTAPPHTVVRVRVVALLPALGVALAVVTTTRWPVAGALAFVAVAAAPESLKTSRHRRAVIARAAAVGTWCLQLADLLDRSRGAPSAVVASAITAPAPIRPYVARLAKAQRRNPQTALAEFCEAVGDESADLIANLLWLDSRGRGGRLADSLRQLSVDIAASVDSRQRIEVSRVRTRAAARAAAGTAILGVVIFVVGNREFLAAYDSAAGQMVLAVLGSAFVGCLWLLARMDRPLPVERFPLPVVIREGAQSVDRRSTAGRRTDT